MTNSAGKSRKSKLGFSIARVTFRSLGADILLINGLLFLASTTSCLTSFHHPIPTSMLLAAIIVYAHIYATSIPGSALEISTRRSQSVEWRHHQGFAEASPALATSITRREIPLVLN